MALIAADRFSAAKMVSSSMRTIISATKGLKLSNKNKMHKRICFGSGAATPSMACRVPHDN